MIRALLILLIAWITSSCVGTTDQLNSQMQQDLQNYGTEAVALREQIQIDRTAIVVTVDAANAQARQFELYNSILRQTAVAGQPPTATIPPIEANAQGPMPISMFDLSDGQMRFVQVGTASQIDGDRCFISHQTFFRDTEVSIIYITGLALNLVAGTQVRAEWRYGDQVVYANAWIAPQSVDGQCFALELRPSDAPFLPGNWTVMLLINGESANSASFTIIGNS
jgi:hypothetical protein